MKILKIVVDKLPEGCYINEDNSCHFWQCYTPIAGNDWCNALNRETESNQACRPDWCPLALESEEEICF